MNKLTVGIDIAKLTFVAALKAQAEAPHQVKSFSNDADGFDKFSKWLAEFSDERYHCCMESTGKYGLALALFLHQRDHEVSIVNPARIKYYMQSLLSRNKTDLVDAKLIHDFSVTFSPSLWRPLPDKIQRLQALVMRNEALAKMLRQEKNRLENIESVIYQSVADHIEYIENEMKKIESKIANHITSDEQLSSDAELLQSIPGIGNKTASKTLAFLSHINNFSHPKQLAAYIGLNPQHAQSGTSLNYSHLSKTGDSNLRKMLFLPALSAIRNNPEMNAFYLKLTGKGKPKKVAICAVMRKLVHIIFGVLKSKKPFILGYST